MAAGSAYSLMSAVFLRSSPTCSLFSRSTNRKALPLSNSISHHTNFQRKIFHPILFFFRPSVQRHSLPARETPTSAVGENPLSSALNSLFLLSASAALSLCLFIADADSASAFVVTPPKKLQSDELATVRLFQENTPSVVYITNLAARQDAFTLDVLEVPQGSAGLPSDIVRISAGHYHSLAVTASGHLWAWGRNNEGQLGRGLSPLNLWNEPKHVSGLEEVKITAAFASGVVSAAIGDDGSLWVWGKSKRGQLGLGRDVVEALTPVKVEALTGEKIAKVSFGWGHAFAQTVDGKLFGWGYSADGRIGTAGGALERSPLESRADTFENHQQFSTSRLEVAEKIVLEAMKKEENMPIVWEPCLVEELSCIEVVDIACGFDHSLILCRDGTLLSSGSNIYGQLGRVKQDLGMFPVDLDSHPTSIASGLGHSLAICQVTAPDVDGGSQNIFSWGWNQFHQLGRVGLDNFPSPVEELAREIPVSVSGGRSHSIALTSKGEVFVWGSGRNGRLGLGSSCNEDVPTLLDYLKGFNVLQAVSGLDHNLVLVSE